ncbi:peptidoglycan editing factor PgeF [Candidatus Dependentiae bacterium]|nr:peptidoglycan editing factor PgeF [Candidatus Dependentiae bacterium]
MILHNDPSYKIYFGDSKDDCVKSDGQINKEYFEKKLQDLKLDNLIFLKQIHSNKGICIDSPSLLNKKLILFEQEGDFIITNQRNVGIGILTADCLPVVFYDPVNHVVGVVHVGWKGAVTNIISNVIKKLKKCFNTDTSKIKIYFGPSARVCCYQISNEFIKNFDNCSFCEDIFLKKDGSLHLDLPKLVKNQLLDLGVPKGEINFDYNSCTICDLRFHSYRRSNQDPGRQATIVALK